MMMNFSGWGSFGLGHQLNTLFALIFITGFILLIVWLVKFSKKETLRNWIVGLLIVGLIGWLISAPMNMFQGWNRRMSSFGSGSGMMMSGEMFNCMQNDKCHEEMEEFMHEMMGLEHQE